MYICHSYAPVHEYANEQVSNQVSNQVISPVFNTLDYIIAYTKQDSDQVSDQVNTILNATVHNRVIEMLNIIGDKQIKSIILFKQRYLTKSQTNKLKYFNRLIDLGWVQMTDTNSKKSPQQTYQ
ncbi:MAG: hypothetical protein ACOYMA_03750 [Bacteroidia bacterium]